jgi:cupin 2 domain-containing protein
MMINNLFTHITQASDSEVFETLLQTDALKLERVVSTGQATPPGQWYDQDRDEWVVLLSGSAGLLFDGERDIRVLKPGDYLLIPAHTRHRVEWTETVTETVWLALHYTTWLPLS